MGCVQEQQCYPFCCFCLRFLFFFGACPALHFINVYFSLHIVLMSSTPSSPQCTVGRRSSDHSIWDYAMERACAWRQTDWDGFCIIGVRRADVVDDIPHTVRKSPDWSLHTDVARHFLTCRQVGWFLRDPSVSRTPDPPAVTPNVH